MSPFTWVSLMVISYVALIALSQIQLMQDLVTSTGFSSNEVFAGMGGILMVFYVFLAIFEVR